MLIVNPVTALLYLFERTSSYIQVQQPVKFDDYYYFLTRIDLKTHQFSLKLPLKWEGGDSNPVNVLDTVDE